MSHTNRDLVTRVIKLKKNCIMKNLNIFYCCSQFCTQNIHNIVGVLSKCIHVNKIERKKKLIINLSIRKKTFEYFSTNNHEHKSA